MSLEWLKNRWLLGTLGLTAFALVVWFVGDTLLVGAWRPLEQPAGRVLLIAAAAAAWLAAEILRLRRSRRENEKLLEVLAGGGSEADSAVRAAREIEVLRQRFEEAAALPKKARFKGADGEQRYVSELPWYVFIGAPGSGKTTALVNAGLRFPLRGAGGDPSLAGVGGTRNCDWWFSEEAVLLDTAGRYTTQKSDLQADAAAWTGFLDLLKRFRPRRPLNGALVTVSAMDLMLWNEDERRDYGWQVRARVAELYERLGVRFPVYVVVTKMDLLAGFMEFFGELSAEDRERVWGATFEFTADDFTAGTPGQRFMAEFEALERRLYDEMIERLQEEKDLQRRASIYRFPQEFHGIGALIEQFMDSAFIGVQGAPEPLVRGVYFTSGTQEGSPIDRVLGMLARSFNLERAAVPAAAGTGKSFFLKRLLHGVIFAESGLAGGDERLERRLRQARMLAFGAIAAVSAVLGFLWTLSYSGNRDFIAAAQAKSAAAKVELQGLGALAAGEEARLLRALGSLRDLPGGYRDREESKKGGTSVTPGFGLSQGDKLGGQALRAYRNALRDVLLPRLGASLEDALRSATDRGPLSEAIAAYLGLFEAKPDPKLLQAAAVRLWRLPDADRAELAGHLRAALEEGPPEMHHPRDEAIIKGARQRLAAAKI